MTSAGYEDREQTAVKHEILERYLSAFVPIVGDWAADIAYIDCLAGPWESTNPDFRDTSFGRAISVLRSTRQILKGRGKSPTMRCLFIEKDSRAFQRLKQYCDKITDIEVTAKQWDFSQHVQDVVRFAKERSKSISFTFIDPTGWDTLGIELIKPILALEPGEVLINLMTSFITRFLIRPERGLGQLFPKDWPKLAELSGEEKEENAVSCYANEVRIAGRFRYICTLPVMKSSQDAFYFHMIYATRHPEGVNVFKETEKYVIPVMHEMRAEAQERKKVEQTGQPGLFSPQTLYREARFTRYRDRSLEVARKELREKLLTSTKLSYDDAWAITMQYSAVFEADLRVWLTDWHEAGMLEITNQKPRQKVPRRNSGQELIWKKGAKK